MLQLKPSFQYIINKEHYYTQFFIYNSLDIKVYAMWRAKTMIAKYTSTTARVQWYIGAFIE